MCSTPRMRNGELVGNDAALLSTYLAGGIKPGIQP